MNESTAKRTDKRSWALSGESFEALLKWIDDGNESEGRSYLEMRQRLIVYFDRKNCVDPDDLADEVLDRVARRIEEEGSIITDAPAKYCYTVARFVLLEYFRRSERRNVPIDEKPNYPEPASSIDPNHAEEIIRKESMLKCLDQCTEKLDEQSKTTITRYYHGVERIKIENRAALAESLGITVNALSIRACRIRAKLETCVSTCVGDK